MAANCPKCEEFVASLRSDHPDGAVGQVCDVRYYQRPFCFSTLSVAVDPAASNDMSKSHRPRIFPVG